MLVQIHEKTDTSVRLDSISCFRPLDYGFRIYKDMEICRIDKIDTSEGWYILVFKNGLHTKDCGVMISGVYLSPTPPPLKETCFGTKFKGYLLSVPYDSWRALDIYNLEELSSFCRSNPYVELETEQIISFGLVMDILYTTLESDDRYGSKEELTNVYWALMAMLAGHYRIDKELPNHPNYRRGSPAQRFISLVDEHCLQERKLDFYASKLNLSEKYLSHIVSRETGKKAKEWICDSIVKKSKKCLLNTSYDTTIDTVAKLTGFVTSSDFCRFFRLHTGMTPLQYRRQRINALHPEIHDDLYEDRIQ